MDLSENSGSCSNHIMVGGPESLSGASCQSDSGATIALQLLEFKAHLLEAVEELHIRRDAESRFEKQINKVLLDKQEVEQEKRTLQHQIEAASNQHRLLQRQLQAKIRHMEEEKAKNQQIVELKEKQIFSLKEELNSLQLLKYNLEKKSSELEQKLALQSRSKDSHLNKMGEVERRFSALSRQCAALKQAHGELVHNVDEAMRINTKLTSVNEQQEVTIQSLKQEVEEVRNKLIKAKMSSGQQGKSHSPAHKDQHIEHLQHKLSMEAEMNKRLMGENEAVRAEKQEVMRSLQHTHQLLLSQTQTASRAEVDLRTKAEQHQALKREHEVMREKSKATEDKVARLLDSYAAAESTWDAERTRLLDNVRRAERELQALREAHGELRREHAQLSTWAEAHTQRSQDLEVSACHPSPSVSAGLLPPGGAKAFNEPDCGPAPPWSSGGQREDAASPQITKPDGRGGNRTAATGATGGHEASNPDQASPFTEPSPDPLTTTLEAAICTAPSLPADEAASKVRTLAAFSCTTVGAPTQEGECRQEEAEKRRPRGGLNGEDDTQTGGDDKKSRAPPVTDSSGGSWDLPQKLIDISHAGGDPTAVNRDPPPAPQRVRTNVGALIGQRVMDESGCSRPFDIQDPHTDTSSTLNDADTGPNRRSALMKKLDESEQVNVEIPIVRGESDPDGATLNAGEAPQYDPRDVCFDVEPEGTFTNSEHADVVLSSSGAEGFKLPLPKEGPLAVREEESPVTGGSAHGGSLDWRGAKRRVERATTADVPQQFTQCATPSAASASSGESGMTSRTNTPGYSLPPAPAMGSNPDGEPEPSCSQEREQQQASLRAQISRIEQFLSTETLHLPKRRRTDN